MVSSLLIIQEAPSKPPPVSQHASRIPELNAPFESQSHQCQMWREQNLPPLPGYSPVHLSKKHNGFFGPRVASGTHVHLGYLYPESLSAALLFHAVPYIVSGCPILSVGASTVIACTALYRQHKLTFPCYVTVVVCYKQAAHHDSDAAIASYHV